MLRQTGKYPQLEVRQRTDRERNAVAGQPGHERRVVQGLNAMIDAFDLEHIKRAPDVSRRALLAGMGHEPQAQSAGARKHTGKLFGRMPELARR